jgi:hypothetical protein
MRMTMLAVIPGEDPGSMQPKPQAEWVPAFAGMTESVGVVPSHQRRRP